MSLHGQEFGQEKWATETALMACKENTYLIWLVPALVKQPSGKPVGGAKAAKFGHGSVMRLGLEETNDDIGPKR